jgi:hypothetical protein
MAKVAPRRHAASGVVQAAARRLLDGAPSGCPYEGSEPVYRKMNRP